MSNETKDLVVTDPELRDDASSARTLPVLPVRDTVLFPHAVLPLTVGIARRWGRLAAKLGNKQLDLAIAATALEHGLIVVTRNVSDFQPTGVRLFQARR